MNEELFDNLTRLLARGVTRRDTLKLLGGALGTALLTSLGCKIRSPIASPGLAEISCPKCGACTACDSDLEADALDCGVCPTPCTAAALCQQANDNGQHQSLVRHLFEKGFDQSEEPEAFLLNHDDALPASSIVTRYSHTRQPNQSAEAHYTTLSSGESAVYAIVYNDNEPSHGLIIGEGEDVEIVHPSRRSAKRRSDKISLATAGSCHDCEDNCTHICNSFLGTNRCGKLGGVGCFTNFRDPGATVDCTIEIVKACTESDVANCKKRCAALCCPAGMTCCDSGCADLNSDSNNCGGCGDACDGCSKCVDGFCEAGCNPGESCCDDACVDIRFDPKNCGGCGIACDGCDKCVDGVCVPGCDFGEICCDEKCADPKSDSLNCGGCGNGCDSCSECSEGVCLGCKPGQACCDGECVDTSSDLGNCGECGRACGKCEKCENGECLSCGADELCCGSRCHPYEECELCCGGRICCDWPKEGCCSNFDGSAATCCDREAGEACYVTLTQVLCCPGPGQTGCANGEDLSCCGEGESCCPEDPYNPVPGENVCRKCPSDLCCSFNACNPCQPGDICCIIEGSPIGCCTPNVNCPSNCA